ncbi:hypothetical protein [Streptomyces lunaelactis]|uniref:hypothetical protein n=1 Tax=Streptomyces lunaelactis TaxID=1535768 RepID=UPI00131F114D|nr:hypothetical protein [Streptomyces lunaelactis]NUK84967.1 hypothetical protein [Streptomyces lunaelactis]
MRVRKTAGLNQSDSSIVKVSTARFDRFGRRFSGGVRVAAITPSPVRGGVRFGEYTQVMTNMPLLKSIARTGLAGGAL